VNFSRILCTKTENFDLSTSDSFIGRIAGKPQATGVFLVGCSVRQKSGQVIQLLPVS
jgi:hypothetical protein